MLAPVWFGNESWEFEDPARDTTNFISGSNSCQETLNLPGDGTDAAFDAFFLLPASTCAIIGVGSMPPLSK